MPTTTEYTADEVGEMLRAGARHLGTNTGHAAIHLLTFTELIDDPDLVTDHLDITTITDPRSGQQVAAALVRDWAALRDSDLTRRAGGAATRMLTLAAGWATGEYVDVRDCFTGYGTAHAHRVGEAVTIATGHAGY